MHLLQIDFSNDGEKRVRLDIHMYKASAEKMQVLLAIIYSALRMYVQTYT